MRSAADVQRGFVTDAPGASPGIEHHEITDLPSGHGSVRISCIDYSPEQALTRGSENVESFVNQHRAQGTLVRWIDVEGFSDRHAIQVLAAKYDLHPLAIEDMLHTTQRAKVEAYGGDDDEFKARLFFVTHALQLQDGQLQHEQISIFLAHRTVLTFHRNPIPEWGAIRQRLSVKGSRLRSSDAGFLVYSLLDAVVDGCFPILEAYSERAEELEAQILEHPRPQLINEIHQFKRDLLAMRWVIWPMREVMSRLQRETHECVSENTRIYMRDLYDHTAQIIDIIGNYREIASDLVETYMSSVSNRMNEIMKVLTIIGTIFIPLTFLAGVYGMNFHYLPELELSWGYPGFWALCITIAGAMLLIFRKRRWF